MSDAMTMDASPAPRHVAPGTFRLFALILVVVGASAAALSYAIVGGQDAEVAARRADLSARCAGLGASLHEAVLDSYCVTPDGVIKGVPPRRP